MTGRPRSKDRRGLDRARPHCDLVLRRRAFLPLALAG
jgi:hypothetical protein